METLFDYVQWMGDFPIEATGLLEADALVLGLLSYYDYDPLFERMPDTDVFLRDCLPMLEEDLIKVTISGRGQDYPGFLRLAAATKRFGDLRMTHYVDVLLTEPAVQFSAVSFHDDANRSFLVYRGTDTSLAGWKEDFMISFTRTRAQTQALAYANAYIDPARKNYLIGHSKGGNEALYAAANLRDSRWDAVEHVYILDGPGFCPEVLDVSGVERVDEKATHILPKFSIVGKLFAAQLSDIRIIDSAGAGFAQHSLINWHIDHGKLALLEENDATSLWVNATVDGWIDGMDMDARKVLVEDLFDALSASGAEYLDELDDGGIAGFDKILRRLRDSNETTHKLIAELPRHAMKQTLQGLREKLRREDREPKEQSEPAAEPAGAV